MADFSEQQTESGSEAQTYGGIFSMFPLTFKYNRVHPQHKHDLLRVSLSLVKLAQATVVSRAQDRSRIFQEGERADMLPVLY